MNGTAKGSHASKMQALKTELDQMSADYIRISREVSYINKASLTREEQEKLVLLSKLDCESETKTLPGSTESYYETGKGFLNSTNNREHLASCLIAWNKYLPLRTAIFSLPTMYRSIFVARYIRCLSVDEVYQEFQLGKSTYYRQFNEGITILCSTNRENGPEHINYLKI